MAAVQRKPGSGVVEIPHPEVLGIVALSALPARELISVGLLLLVADAAPGDPLLNRGATMVEGLEEEDILGMAELTAGLAEPALVGVILPMAGAALLPSRDAEAKLTVAGIVADMTGHARCDPMGSNQPRGSLPVVALQVEGRWSPGVLDVALVAPPPLQLPPMPIQVAGRTSTEVGTRVGPPPFSGPHELQSDSVRLPAGIMAGLAGSLSVRTLQGKGRGGVVEPGFHPGPRDSLPPGGHVAHIAPAPEPTAVGIDVARPAIV